MSAVAPISPVVAARSLAAATLAGMVGHRVDAGEGWLPKMAFRVAGRDVDADALLATIGTRRGNHRPIDVAVLVHGLFVDEQNWTRGPDPLPGRLEALFGWSPILVRFNTGLHISDNGEALARLLVELHDAWGPRLGRIQVVGHSMGGLVSRSALAALERQNAAVLERVERLFLLATPNHGADLERLGHFIEVSLRRAAQLSKPDGQGGALAVRARAVAPALVAPAVGELAQRLAVRAGATASLPARSLESLLALRSDGIRDVRYGYMLRAEWESAADAGDPLLTSHRRRLPPPPHVRTFAVAGSLWPTAGARPSRLRTDGLVSCASAAGVGEFDDLGVVASGHYAEVPVLLHQLVPASRRVRAHLRGWAEHERR
ncbi:MAG: alpha/beta hydrolase [Myxococcales bacterium]|nr:alpha/beta hydrolase [Myxococcales bacterium]MCB9520778.1 alpha/beta hydrolase [Myxococcales bacterium]MCB9532478.1 alpha/beta hydrolase [Myxococcales bacterium]MCB9533495.1 alpha/beta hydrolase [Myxococcales bacterium]